MRIVLQRIKRCSVFYNGNLINKVGKGALILLGISKKDTLEDIANITKKILNLRIFMSNNKEVSIKEINGEFIVDTGHVVAFDPSLDYSISGMGNFKSTMLSGEGLVMRFKGSGKLYLQTRNVSSVASWLTPRLLG